LTFPLAVLAEVEFRRGKIAAAYAPAHEFTQLAAESRQAIIFLLACRHWAGSGLSCHDEDCRAYIAGWIRILSSNRLGRD